jgi:hypothetical protein
MSLLCKISNKKLYLLKCAKISIKLYYKLFFILINRRSRAGSHPGQKGRRPVAQAKQRPISATLYIYYREKQSHGGKEK